MQYLLENDHLRVVCDTFGGSLISIQNQEGLEYLWQGDPAYWSGQAPVLFPICGSLRQHRAQTRDGELISMPRHGLIRKEEFVCEFSSENEIVFFIESSPEMKKHYPFDFQFRIKYRLVGARIDVTYQVTNLSQKTMPFFVGGHPAFNCPLESHLEFEDYVVTFEKREEVILPDCQLETGLVNRLEKRTLDFDGKTLPLDHGLFEKDALIFANSQSKKVSLSSPKGQRSIEVTFADFAHLLVWSTANQAPFVALEPMQGLSTYTDESDIFEDKEHVQLLEPQQEKSYQYSINCK